MSITSINREFDFVRMDGLRRATGRPPHEWDIYIVKELIDNALDADERLWQRGELDAIDISVEVEYTYIPELQSRQLFVRVSNRGAFPVEQIEAIFSTQQYTSSKQFGKGLTRGALGNALKTILGIPYALRERVSGSWKPTLQPMTIVCGDVGLRPKYHIDTTAQTITFSCPQKAQRRPIDGTRISVGIDSFDQERPRTLADWQQIAAQYHLCNPHVRFQWRVAIDEEAWQWETAVDATWHDKYAGQPPIHWYAVTFHELLGALFRQHGGDELPLEAVTAALAGVDAERVGAVFGRNHITPADLDNPHLYHSLAQQTRPLDSAELGQIGAPHLTRAVAAHFATEGAVVYRQTSDSDPSVPFVLEVAVAFLNEDAAPQRHIWTGINFTPTYGDPFLRSWLTSAAHDDPVLGLRGLLDSYGIDDDTPFVLCLHLVCPTVEHNDFSKTQINHLPFKQHLTAVLDDALSALQRQREEEALALQQTIFAALDTILARVAQGERFIIAQLLTQLRRALAEIDSLTAWLARPDVDSRLQTFILDYQSQQTRMAGQVARAALGIVSLPVHPDRHIAMRVEHLSAEIFPHHHVNKLLYIPAPQWEAVVLDNNWLCKLDCAFLHALPAAALKAPFINLLTQSDYPLILLTDEAQEPQLTQQMRQWAESAALDPTRIHALTVVGNLHDYMPNALFDWLCEQLQRRDLPRKQLPDPAQLRQDIRAQIDKSLREMIWSGYERQIAINQLLIQLETAHQLPDALDIAKLDQQIRDRLAQPACKTAYNTELSRAVTAFYESWMATHGIEIRHTIQQHIRK